MDDKPKKKRSDWRTYPRDEFLVPHEDGEGHEQLSFVRYLAVDYPRGRDWDPCGVLGTPWKLHVTPRDKRGKLSGEPLMTKKFLNWLSGDHKSGIRCGEIREAIGRAKVRKPGVIAVLEWRQGLGPSAGLTPSEYMTRHSIGSSKTLTNRIYQAAMLVLDEVDRVRAFKGGT